MIDTYLFFFTYSINLFLFSEILSDCTAPYTITSRPASKRNSATQMPVKPYHVTWAPILQSRNCATQTPASHKESSVWDQAQRWDQYHLWYLWISNIFKHYLLLLLYCYNLIVHKNKISLYVNKYPFFFL